MAEEPKVLSWSQCLAQIQREAAPVMADIMLLREANSALVGMLLEFPIDTGVLVRVSVEPWPIPAKG